MMSDRTEIEAGSKRQKGDKDYMSRSSAFDASNWHPAVERTIKVSQPVELACYTRDSAKDGGELRHGHRSGLPSYLQNASRHFLLSSLLSLHCFLRELAHILDLRNSVFSILSLPSLVATLQNDLHNHHDRPDQLSQSLHLLSRY